MDTSSPAWRWLGIALAVVVGIGQGPAFLASLRPSQEELEQEIGDFFQEWSSAQNYYSGRPIYDSLEEAYDRYLGYPRQPDQHLAVRINGHPPTSVLFTLPFGLLTYPDALLAWNLVCLAALAGSILLVIRQLGWRPPLWTVFPVAAGFLICYPFRQHIRLGQLNFILLLLLTAAWAGDRNGRWVWSGFWLGLATAIKLFPGFLVIYWLLKREWRPIVAVMISFTLWTLTTIAVLGVAVVRDYVTLAMPGLRQSWSGWSNISLTSLWVKLFDPAIQERVEPLVQGPAAHAVGWFCIIASAAIVLWFSARCLPPPGADRARSDHFFAILVFAMLLLSPVTWSHYLVLLWLPTALVWPLISKQPSTVIAYSICLLILCIDPLPLWKATMAWPGGAAQPWQTFTILGYPTYALLGLWLVAIHTRTRLDAGTGSPR